MSSPSPSPQDFAKPDAVTGGCLCGAIRFRIEFPKDHDFLKNCRRGSGGLIWHSHTVPAANLAYTTPTTELRSFSATRGVQRGFCAKCGSFLHWKEDESREVYVSVACVDPEFLRDGEGGGYGYALANSSRGHIYCENEIRGVNEGWVGKKENRWEREELHVEPKAEL
ncbi:hypothetical protein TruAng_007480 [Truncatella angustata]|nr:hypothetical protein TruAng_007480 [Truncatella angustata]